MSASWDRLPFAVLEQLLLWVSRIEEPPFTLKHQRLRKVAEEKWTIEAANVEPVPVDYHSCQALGRTCKRFNHAWRVFQMRHTLDHVAAVVRGHQLRNWFRCILDSPRTLERMRTECGGVNEDLFDRMCLAANRFGPLCVINSRKKGDSLYTDRRCVAEAIRSDRLLYNKPRHSGDHAETMFCLESGLFFDQALTTSDDVTLNWSRANLRDVELPASFFGAVDVFFQTIDLDLVLLDGVDAPLKNSYFQPRGSRTRLLSFPMAQAVCEAFPALRDWFGVLSRRTYDGRGLLLPDIVVLLQDALFDTGDDAAFDFCTYEHSLCLPPELFVPALLEKHGTECIDDGLHRELGAAIAATHGTPKATRRTMTFLLFHMILAIVYHRPAVRPLAIINNPSNMNNNLRILTLAEDAIKNVCWRAGELAASYGIKLSDHGILSAADVILQVFDPRIHRSRGQPAWRAAIACGPDEPIGRSLTARLRRDFESMHASLIGAKGMETWSVRAACSQRKSMLYWPGAARYALATDVAFPPAHRGVARLWAYMDSICKTHNARSLTFMIRGTGDNSLPPLLIDPSVMCRISVDSPPRVIVPLMGDDGTHERVERATYWFTAGSETRQNNTTLRASSQRETCVVDERGIKSRQQLVCSFAANQLGPNAETDTRYVIYWEDTAYGYMRSSLQSEARYNSQGNDRLRYFADLALETAKAGRMRDMLPYFTPLSVRIQAFFDRLDAIEDAAEMQAHIERICVPRGLCLSCRRFMLQPEALRRGTCTACANKKRPHPDAAKSAKAHKAARTE